MSDESSLWQWLSRGLSSRGHLVRIESPTTGDGISDVNYCLDGHEGWIELKHADRPKREKTVVFKSQRGLTGEQISWILYRKRCGGRAFVLIQLGDRRLLIDGKYAARVNLSTSSELEALSLWVSPRAMKAGDWDTLAFHLRLA